ncbi:MAG: MFS transporter [Pirellulaceae bacterium]|nr:MFS transporter [Pirellulaceae bacterium]
MPRLLTERCWRALTMLSLILAGETVFLPAFHLGRYFKSSLLGTFGIDEFQLGRLGAVYGVCATICYFLGGPLADRWSPRKLLASSLVVTALGSLYMATIPGFGGLQVLFGFWGITTILAFWAPLIRATREWAGEDQQGMAFGILDGGRGMASAVIASLAAFAFAAMVGGEAEIDPAREADAVRKLILSYGVYCLASAVCVWFFVPDSRPASIASQPDQDARQVPKLAVLQRLGRVLRTPAIWLQAVVIIAAYSAFKMIDNYGIFAEDAYGLSRTDSAKVIAYISYTRVGAALGAGWIADKCLGVRATIQVCFAMLLAAYAMFLLVTPHAGLVWLMIVNMTVSCLGFFALRGIYFALLEESGTPRELTGTAVGVISFVGYTPEIFMGPLTGWLIREARQQGDVLAGYQQIFWILAALSLGGMLAAFALRWFRCPKRPADEAQAG